MKSVGECFCKLPALRTQVADLRTACRSSKADTQTARDSYQQAIRSYSIQSACSYFGSATYLGLLRQKCSEVLSFDSCWPGRRCSGVLRRSAMAFSSSTDSEDDEELWRVHQELMQQVPPFLLFVEAAPHSELHTVLMSSRYTSLVNDL